MNRLFQILIVIITLTNLLCSQSYFISKYRTENGLSANYINFTFKSSDGFLWISTQNGVNRFDGNTFKNYLYKENDSLSIGSNSIKKIVESSSKELIFLHDKGYSILQKSTNTFNQVDAKMLSLTKGEVIKNICQYEENIFTLITNYRLLLFDNKNYKILKGCKISDKPLQHASTVINPNGNQLLILADNNLYDYDFINNSLKFKINLKGIDAAYMLFSNNNKIYISTYNKGALVYDVINNNLKQISTPGNTGYYDAVRSITLINESNLLVASELNLYDYAIKDNLFKNILSENIFSGSVINHGTIDNTDIWVSTSTGLILLRKENLRLNEIDFPAIRGSIANVQSVEESNKLYFSDYTSGNIYQLLSGKHSIEFQTLKKESLRYVFIDNFNNEWITTDNNCFIKKKDTQKWEEIILPLNTVPRNMLSDKSGNTYLRDRNKGVLKYNYQKAVFEDFIIFNQDELPVSGMVISKSKNIIVLSLQQTGIFLYNLNINKSEYIYTASNKTNISIGNVTLLNDSMIVLSDVINGITFININNNKKYFYTTTQGLLSNNNETVARDDKGRIWTFSSEGINAIDFEKDEVYSYKSKKLELIQNISYNNNKIYAATSKGIVWWNTDHLESTYKKPLLYTDYAMQGSSKLSWPNELVLNYTENNITLNFGVFSDPSLSKPHVEYKFEGEEKWHDLFATYTLSFHKLSPGSYKLFIRTKDNDNSSQWLHSSWSINKPWYFRWWFILSLLSLIFVSVYLFIKYRIDDLKQKADLRHKVNEYKTSALRAQMNPHFIFNSLAGIDNLILDNQTKLASDYLYKFAKLLRAVLDSSKNEVINFSNDWNTMKLYIELEQLRSNQQFSYEMIADDALLNGHYSVPPLIIQPYIENAIIHGIRKVNDGKLTITATLKNEILTYSIIDNGIGVQEENKNILHKSYGMDINKERITIFNKGKIEDNFAIESQINKGTKITIKLLV